MVESMNTQNNTEAPREYSVEGHGLGILAVYGGPVAGPRERYLTRTEAWEIARKLASRVDLYHTIQVKRGAAVVFRANHSVDNGWKGRDANGAPVKVVPLPYDLP